MKNLSIHASLTFVFFLSYANPVFAGPPWDSGGLQCAVDTMDSSTRTDYLLEWSDEPSMHPTDCIIGHWKMDPDVYIDELLRLSENSNVNYNEINVDAEIIIDAQGFAHSCIDVSVSSTIVSRGLEGKLVLTMEGPTISIIRSRPETTELLEDASGGAWTADAHIVRSIVDGIGYKSVLTVDGTSYTKDIMQLFPSFLALSTDISCTENTMNLTSFPEGVDFVNSRFIRLD